MLEHGQPEESSRPTNRQPDMVAHIQHIRICFWARWVTIRYKMRHSIRSGHTYFGRRAPTFESVMKSSGTLAWPSLVFMSAGGWCLDQPRKHPLHNRRELSYSLAAWIRHIVGMNITNKHDRVSVCWTCTWVCAMNSSNSCPNLPCTLARPNRFSAVVTCALWAYAAWKNMLNSYSVGRRSSW